MIRRPSYYLCRVARIASELLSTFSSDFAAANLWRREHFIHTAKAQFRPFHFDLVWGERSDVIRPIKTETEPRMGPVGVVISRNRWTFIEARPGPFFRTKTPPLGARSQAQQLAGGQLAALLSNQLAVLLPCPSIHIYYCILLYIIVFIIAANIFCYFPISTPF